MLSDAAGLLTVPPGISRARRCLPRQALLHTPPAEMDSHFQPITMLCELMTFPYTEFVDLNNSTQVDAASRRMGFNVTMTEVQARWVLAGPAWAWQRARAHIT